MATILETIRNRYGNKDKRTAALATVPRGSQGQPTLTVERKVATNQVGRPVISSNRASSVYPVVSNIDNGSSPSPVPFGVRSKRVWRAPGDLPVIMETGREQRPSGNSATGPNRGSAKSILSLEQHMIRGIQSGQVYNLRHEVKAVHRMDIPQTTERFWTTGQTTTGVMPPYAKYTETFAGRIVNPSPLLIKGGVSRQRMTDLPRWDQREAQRFNGIHGAFGQNRVAMPMVQNSQYPGKLPTSGMRAFGTAPNIPRQSSAIWSEQPASASVKSRKQRL
jgi:hypothetical protein